MFVSNIKLFSIKPKYEKPEVPKYWDDESPNYPNGRWLDNPHDPTYHAELKLFAMLRGDAAFDYIIENTPIPPNFVMTQDEQDELSIIMNDNESLEFAYKKYIVFSNGFEVVNNSCLTENRVYEYFEPIEHTASRSGDSLLEYPLKFSINMSTSTEPLTISGCQLVHPVDEAACCSDMNISWMDWITGKYTLDEMAQSIAVWRLGKIIESHKQDEVNIFQEKQSKKKH